jgi:hypothetical protein
MRIVAGVAAIIVLAACDTVPTVSTPASPTAAAVICRLPVSGNIAGNPMGGFISFPSGTFGLDQTSETVWDAAKHLWRTMQAPFLYGDGGLTYDRPDRRWLPVERNQVLPDGSAYVYTNSLSPTLIEIHKVQVATGTDTVIYDQGPYRAVFYLPEGVYLASNTFRSGSGIGLWFLDPNTGSVKSYSDTFNYWSAVTGGGAWSVDYYLHGSITIVRLDLATGTQATWFSLPATPPVGLGGNYSPFFHLAGFDAQSRPLVQVFTDSTAQGAYLLTAPGSATRLDGSSPLPAFGSMGVTDARGTWLSAADGVYMYRGASFNPAFEKRAISQEAPPPFNAGYEVAGGCA